MCHLPFAQGSQEGLLGGSTAVHECSACLFISCAGHSRQQHQAPGRYFESRAFRKSDPTGFGTRIANGKLQRHWQAATLKLRFGTVPETRCRFWPVCTSKDTCATLSFQANGLSHSVLKWNAELFYALFDSRSTVWAW